MFGFLHSSEERQLQNDANSLRVYHHITNTITNVRVRAQRKQSKKKFC